MRIERNAWNKNSPTDDYDDDDDFDIGVQINPVVGFTGFLLAVSLYGVAIWGVAEILYKQDAISWNFEPWQPYVISLAYFVMRSMNRVMYPKFPWSNRRW